MRILAFDTSAPRGFAAVIEGEVERVGTTWSAERGHAETLIPALEEMVAKVGMTASEMDLLAVGLGPGSFTGVRVGIAVAKGLALTGDVPVVGVPSLRVLARGLGSVDLAVAVRDVRRGEVYLQGWADRSDGRGTGVEPFCGSPVAAARALRAAAGTRSPTLCGSGLRAHQEQFLAALGSPFQVASTDHDVGSGLGLALEAVERLHRRGPDEVATLDAIYARPSDAKLPDRPLRVEPSEG